MPSGSGGQIALTAVGSLYFTANSQTISGMAWTNFVSENLEHTIGELVEGSITGYKARPPSYKGLDSAQGDITLEPNPNAIGHFLKGVFGISSGTVLTEAGSWGANSGNALNLPPGYGTNARPVVRHLFTATQSAYEDRCFLPPYAVMLYKDTGSAWIFNGSVFPSLTIGITAGQLARATVNVMARDVQRHARTNSVSALRNPGGRPWIWDQTSVQLGPGVSSLAAFDRFASFELKYDCPMEGVVLLDGTKKYAEFQNNGFQMVEVNGTLSFRDHQEYDSFITYEPLFARLTLTQTNSSMIIGNPASANYYTMQIDVPDFKFTQFSAPIQGPNRITATFRAVGEFDTTSLYNLQIALTNTTSRY